MVSFRSLALLAAATLAAGQEVSSLLPCAQKCFTDVAASLADKCSPTDAFCLCKLPEWKNGIQECAQAACTDDPNYFGTAIAAANALCATAAPPAPTVSPTPTPAPSAQAPPTTSAPPPPPAATSSSSSSTSTSTSATEPAAKLTSSTTSHTSSATKTASTSHSSTTAAAPAATTSAAAAPAPAEGLSTATKIGIGVGAVAAAAALIGVAICALLRRRQTKRNSAATKNWKISEPMPVSGRAYGHDYSNSYETGLSELEMKSRRYEDMLPRQVPRQMV